jgi:membrane protease YdiL (CAAX protease family)
VVGLGGGVLLYVAAAGASWAAMGLFDTAHYAEPLERLMAGSPIGVPMLVLLGIVNGSYEEIFLLGFLLRGLRGYGLAVAIGLSLLVRVLYHLYQGPLGAINASMIGLAFSLSYVATGRLFPAVFAHVLWDIVPFLLWS